MGTLHHILKILPAGVALALAMASTATADGNSNKDKIMEVLRNYQSFVNESNADGLGSLYTVDAVLLPDRFQLFQGAEAITGFYAFAFNALTLDLEFSIDPADIVVAGDTAYATTSSTGTRFIKEAGQTVPEINRELWVFEQIDGDWKIARYAFNKSE